MRQVTTKPGKAQTVANGSAQETVGPPVMARRSPGAALPDYLTMLAVDASHSAAPKRAAIATTPRSLSTTLNIDALPTRDLQGEIQSIGLWLHKHPNLSSTRSHLEGVLWNLKIALRKRIGPLRIHGKGDTYSSLQAEWRRQLPGDYFEFGTTKVGLFTDYLRIYYLDDPSRPLKLIWHLRGVGPSIECDVPRRLVPFRDPDDAALIRLIEPQKLAQIQSMQSSGALWAYDIDWKWALRGASTALTLERDAETGKMLPPIINDFTAPHLCPYINKAMRHGTYDQAALFAGTAVPFMSAVMATTSGVASSGTGIPGRLGRLWRRGVPLASRLSPRLSSLAAKQVRFGGEIAAGFTEVEAMAFGRFLGKPLNHSDIHLLGRLWDNAARAGDRAALTSANSRYLYDLHRGRFWTRVRADPQARAIFENAGCLFDKGAPYYMRGNEKIIVTIDHIVERQTAPHLALDASNLRLSFLRENTVVLRLLHDKDPFLRPGNVVFRSLQQLGD